MIIETSNTRKAELLSNSKLDNHGIAAIEGTNLRRAGEIRQLDEAKIYEYARSERPDAEKWQGLSSKVSRGRIPTEAYVILRMSDFSYNRIFELADREMKVRTEKLECQYKNE